MYADLCKMLGVKYPIIQGAMAWISNASLVSAVSEATLTQRAAEPKLKK